MVSRSPNAAALAKLQTKLGAEPLILIEVDWTLTSTFKYADKDFLGISGKILDLGGLDAIQKIGSSGAAGSISVTLDDTDDSIKTLLETEDIHKRPARVYQVYEGLAETDKFLLLSGEVSSPISWNEGERTISFDIVSNVEDKELGFSPEEGEFDFIADSAIGVPWPLAFGTVVRVPATRITEAVRGTSLTRYGQITIPELEQLCSLAVAAQQAESAKAVADLLPGFTDANYAVVVDNLTNATISLNTFIDALVFDSPTQETNLLAFVDTCKEIERWRVFFQQEYDKYVDAEARRKPLESTPGKSAVTGFNFFSSTIQTGFNFGEQTRQGYRVGVTIPSYAVTFRAAVPATVGLVDQARAELDTWVDTYYPYTTQEQWDKDEALRASITSLQAQLNDAVGDSSSAYSNILLANSNISSLNTTKKTLETALLQIVLTEIAVDGGEEFPQGSQVEIIVNGMHFKGTFAGRIFTVDQANTPADVSVPISAATDPNQFTLSDATLELKGKYCLFQDGITFVEHQDGATCNISPILYSKTGTVGDASFGHDVYGFRQLSGNIQKTSVFLSLDWINLVRNGGKPDYATGLSILRQRDYAISIGDTVYLASDYKEIYIANLIPSTTIHEVMAWRTLDGERKLVPVPSRYYTVDLNESIAGQNATTLRFKRPLTEFYGEQWEDQIYVSLTSSVGPNTADIIEHLVDTYTDLSKDASSFAAVNASVDPFPSNFAYLDRRGTLGAIEEIAWQARCAAYVKDQTIYLKYLALEETALETVHESVVERKTLELTLTPTEDLVTEFCANWDSDYSAERRNKVVLRNNIGKYGLHTEEFDFYIYNTQDMVVKSATFWLIRMSNTWKIARFRAPLTMLRLETFDTVALHFQNNWIASSSVKGTVEDVRYNSSDFFLEFEVRSSVRAGELTPYVFNWPAGVSVSVEYPTDDDLFAGGATS
jgi:hypothetical protein